MTSTDAPEDIQTRRWQATAFFLVAICLCGVNLYGPTLFDGFGSDPKTLWFFYMVALGIGAVGLCGLLGGWLFGALVATLIIGGSAQLWLTDPLWFPALRFKTDGTMDLAMIGLIAVQAGIAGTILLAKGALGAILPAIRRFGLVRLALFLALLALASVSIMGYLAHGGMRSYILHVIAGGIVAAINLATFWAMGLSRLPDTGGKTFTAIVPAAFALVAAALLAWFAFERLPHVEDEVAYIFQAKTFAGGALTVPAPPEAAWPGLEYYLLEVRDGRWFAVTPPGWTMVLAIGMAVGLPWLVNPVLAFLSVLLAHAIVRRIADRNRANLAALLMAGSPWLLGSAASLMPHILALFLTLFAWNRLLQSRAVEHRHVLNALLAGLAIGWLFTTRQLEGVIIGVLTGIWLLTQMCRPGGMGRLVAYAVGCVLTGSVFLLYNFAMTGDPLLDPLARYLNELWHEGANSYGFGPQIGPPSGWGNLDLYGGHSPFEGLIGTVHNVTAVNLEFLGWGTGSLVLVWAFALWAKPDWFDLAMGIVIAAIIAAMFFYWFTGSFYIGPRYWFSAFFPLVVLSTSGAAAIVSRLDGLAGRGGDAVGLLVLVACAYGAFAFTSWRAVTKYHEYGNFHSLARDESETGRFNGAIVFFDKSVHHGSAFALNDPWLRPGYPLFIRDLGSEADNAVVSQIPERTVIYFTAEELSGKELSGAYGPRCREPSA